MLRIVAAAFLFSTNLWSQSTLSLRADSWFPYNCDPKEAKPGYVVEMIREIYGKHKIVVDYQLMPWSRALSEGEKGTFNGVIGAIKSDAPKFVYPQEPCGLTTNIFYTMKGKSWEFKGLDSLAMVNLAVINDYSYGEKVDDYIAKNKADGKKITIMNGENAVEQAILMLQKGRIDAFIEDENVFTAKINQMKLNMADFVRAGMEGEPEHIYVAFSPAKPDSKSNAEIWDKGVAELRGNGKLAEILAKYSLPDWKKK